MPNLTRWHCVFARARHRAPTVLDTRLLTRVGSQAADSPAHYRRGSMESRREKRDGGACPRCYVVERRTNLGVRTVSRASAPEICASAVSTAASASAVASCAMEVKCTCAMLARRESS